MKFSTRHDTRIAAPELFAHLSDFPRLERLLGDSGVALGRIDPAADPGTGIGWHLAFDWRGRRREMRLDVTDFQRPERIVMTGRSELFDMVIEQTVIALARDRSRLMFELDIRPRTMRARLMLQTAKLGKAQLDRRFDRRIGDYVRSFGPQQG